MPDQGGKARRSTRKSTAPSRDIPSASVSRPPSSRSKARRKDGGDESDSDFPPPHGSSHASGFPPGFETAEELARMPPSDSSRNGPPMKKPKGARPSSPGKARERPPAVVDLLEVPIEPWVTTSRNQFDFPVTFLPVEPPLERRMEYTPLSSAVIAQRARLRRTTPTSLVSPAAIVTPSARKRGCFLRSLSGFSPVVKRTASSFPAGTSSSFRSPRSFFAIVKLANSIPSLKIPTIRLIWRDSNLVPFFEPPRIPKEPAMKPAEAYGSMEEYIASAGAFGAIVAAWHAEKTKLVTEAEDRHCALVSEWEARHALFVEQVPIVHAKASADIERYNTVRCELSLCDRSRGGKKTPKTIKFSILRTSAINRPKTSLTSNRA
ncbi:hypothetical protein C8R47DRAFT_1231345 [Mycena vitilis]|nr:hypothetical protein C8R47DRAFT_1231345 [Mycena vitilis]